LAAALDANTHASAIREVEAMFAAAESTAAPRS
jgi:hypothetical protein